MYNYSSFGMKRKCSYCRGFLQYKNCFYMFVSIIEKKATPKEVEDMELEKSLLYI